MMDIIEKAKKLGIEVPSITAEEINVQIAPVLRKMEKAGIRIDAQVMNDLAKKLGKKTLNLEEEIVKLAGEKFNLGSPAQTADILFVKLKLPTKDLRRTKSGTSTAASELHKIEQTHKIIPLILEYRELSKLISTYLKPLPLLVDENSRLHTTYGLETATGRITSSDPNLQNIPIRGEFGLEIRKAFVASPGMKLISADYSQIELRVVAVLSQDKSMVEAFNSGIDIHTRTASEIFATEADKVTSEMRRIAKTVNFGIIYGVSPFGLAEQTGISVDEAGKYIKQYFMAHPGIAKYMDDMIEMAHKEGYVETLFGTKRYLPNINSYDRYLSASEERMAINMPVQGTAAEIQKLAMIKLDQELEKFRIQNAPVSPTACRGGEFSPRMLLTVHDEIVVEAPAEMAEEIARLTKEVMQNVIKLPIPIEVSVGIGDDWGESK